MRQAMTHHRRNEPRVVGVLALHGMSGDQFLPVPENSAFVPEQLVTVNQTVDGMRSLLCCHPQPVHVYRTSRDGPILVNDLRDDE